MWKIDPLQLNEYNFNKVNKSKSINPNLSHTRIEHKTPEQITLIGNNKAIVKLR